MQIAPAVMREMVEDSNMNKSENAILAIYGIQKIDISKLKEAYEKIKWQLIKYGI